MNVLVLNAGSSTLKFQVIAVSAKPEVEDRSTRLARGVIDRIGGEATVFFQRQDRPEVSESQKVSSHTAALGLILDWLNEGGTDERRTPLRRFSESIEAVGHRVVHGGENFDSSVLVDDDVRRRIEQCIGLAPLHNPHNLSVIDAAREALRVPHAAVFDTAFHATLPPHAFLYAIPYSLYEAYGIRRYGFHGTSHRYVAARYMELTGGTRQGVRVVSLHLGNGCSACAIVDGRSVDTSMGFTPLEGLVMGTRSGDLDPALVEFIASKEGLSLSEVTALLNNRAGLMGISGSTHDMRELIEQAGKDTDSRAALAIRIFAYRARKYAGAYLAAMGGAEAIVFTGGIGENAPLVRSAICEGLEWAGLSLDGERNRAAIGRREGRISSDRGRLAVWVIPTDEELMIARDTAALVSGLPLKPLTSS